MTWRNTPCDVLAAGVLLNTLVVLLSGTRWVVITHLRMIWTPARIRVARRHGKPNERRPCHKVISGGWLARWLGSALSNLSMATSSEAMALLLASRVAHTLAVTLLLVVITALFALAAAESGRGYAESIALDWKEQR